MIGIYAIGMFILFCAFIYQVCAIYINRQKFRALDESEVRRHWLISFFWSAFLTYFGFLTPMIENLDSNQYSYLDFFILISILYLVGTLWFWAVYHCSYKMKGTTLLKLAIITAIPMNILKIFTPEMELITFIVGTTTIGLNLVFAYCSIHLYKINARIRNAKLPKLKKT